MPSAPDINGRSARGRGLSVIAVLAVLATACSTGGGAIASLPTGTTGGVAVVDVRGLSSVVARSRLEAVGLKAELRPGFSTAPLGTVAAQSPAAGVEVAAGSSIDLTVSQGLGVRVPAVVGQPLGRAESMLKGRRFTVSVKHRYALQPKGYVAEQIPVVGLRVSSGSVVTIFVSLGRAPVRVPNVRHLSLAAAEHALAAIGLKYKVQIPAWLKCGRGVSLKTDPHSHSYAAFGSVVRILVCP